MRVAKASQADIDSATNLIQLLNAVDDGCFPPSSEAADSEGEEWPEFDEDNQEDLQQFMRRALRCFNHPPSGLMRVLYAASCALDPSNKLYDPNLNHLATHPRIDAAEELLKAVTEWEASATTGNEFAVKEAAKKLREASV